MGKYNPYAPTIVGEEWVPIREEALTYAADVNTYEQGYRFTLPTATQIGDARFYISDWPQGTTAGQAFQVGIYPAGETESSGPMRSVIIPCNSVGLTGTGATGSVTSVASPADNAYILLPSNVVSSAGFFFAVDNYPFLNGKRILGVDFLYNANVSGSSVSITVPFKTVELRTATSLISELGSLAGTQDTPSPVESIPLGESTAVPLATTAVTSDDRLPWRFVDLQKLQAAATNRIMLVISNQLWSTSPSDNFRIGYAALKVYYCEEKRVAIGGWNFGPGGTSWQIGMNKMTIRNITTYAASPVLAAGDYDIVLSSPNPQSFSSTTFAATGYTAPINALRELFSIPTHPGLKVNIPQVIGDVFTSESTHILPQLSLHASGSGATIQYPHSYGRQATAPIYGAITATTETDSSTSQNTTYPQVRFYARRYGNTTQALTLASSSHPGSTVSITPGDFDELEEILDGWKEITLRFTTPPTFSSGGGIYPWTWSSSGEDVGDRWEVLGARAPAVSGVAGNITQEVPSGQRLGVTTYYAEAGNGATTNLTWLSPPASGAAEDQSSDAVLIFSQDPPTVTGFSVSMNTQSVTGIGELCGETSKCAVTGIYYHRIVWSAVSGPIVTGFGAYELQRMDPFTDWQTIMLTTDPTVTSFNDYEARVGVLSSYRIRALNVYDFAGSWSATRSNTIIAPGVVTAGVSSPKGVLVFTTNELQDGSGNLAYTETFDGNRNEDVVFPEADTVTMQRMYGKDYFTTFHPVERGGERFTRLMLLQNAAVATHTLDNVADAIRNLAWDDVSYVTVRTEQGDRWFASIIIPDVLLKRYRQLQIVRVEITETTDTASPVDTA